MVDLIQAAQDGVFALLQAGTPAQLATVRERVKIDEQPPLIVIGDFDWEDEGGKGDIVFKIRFEIQSVYRGSARRGLLAIMASNMDALVNQVPVAAGVSFSSISFVSGATALADDAVTYGGMQQFEVFAEPA